MQNNQLGFSMIEVMIGLVVSLILALGMIQIFIGSKRSYQLENQFSILQEKSRFGTKYISQFVRLAGYRTPPDGTLYTEMATLFPSGAPHIFVQSQAGTNNSDILTIRYQGSGDGAGNPDGTIVDCLNQGVDANQIVTLTFSINANEELICRSQNPSATNTDNTQVLLTNVENMRIQLGEDLNDDKTPERFVAPNHPNLDFQRVIAARIGLLIRSDEAVNLTTNTNSYELLGNSINTPNDNFVRLTMSETIQLRNCIFEVL